MGADGFDIVDLSGVAGFDSALHEATHEMVDEAALDFVEVDAFFGGGEVGFDFVDEFSGEGNGGAEFGEAEEAGFVGVVGVGGVVGDFVDEVDELGFDGGLEAGEVFGEGAGGAGGEIAGVFDDAFADLEGEVEAGVEGVAVFVDLDDAEGVEVVFKALAVAGEDGVEGVLTGVGKGGMTDVMSEGEGFGEVFVEAEDASGGTGELGDLEGVGEAVAEVIGDAGGKDLGLGFEATEGAGMDDAVTVALEVVAEGGEGLWKAAAPRRFHREAKRGEGADGGHDYFLGAVGGAGGRVLRISIAGVEMGARAVRRGSRSLRASSGLDLARTRPSWRVACSLGSI